MTSVNSDGSDNLFVTFEISLTISEVAKSMHSIISLSPSGKSILMSVVFNRLLF